MYLMFAGIAAAAGLDGVTDDVKLHSGAWEIYLRRLGDGRARVERIGSRCGDGWVNVCWVGVDPAVREAALRGVFRPTVRIEATSASCSGTIVHLPADLGTGLINPSNAATCAAFAKPPADGPRLEFDDGVDASWMVSGEPPPAEPLDAELAALLSDMPTYQSEAALRVEGGSTPRAEGGATPRAEGGSAPRADPAPAPRATGEFALEERELGSLGPIVRSDGEDERKKGRKDEPAYEMVNGRRYLLIDIQELPEDGATRKPSKRP